MAFRPQMPFQNPRMPPIRPANARNFSRVLYRSPPPLWDVPCNPLPPRLPMHPSVQSNMPNRPINPPLNVAPPLWCNNTGYRPNLNPCWPYQEPDNNYPSINPTPGNASSPMVMNPFTRYVSPLPPRRHPDSYKPDTNFPTNGIYSDRWPNVSKSNQIQPPSNKKPVDPLRMEQRVPISVTNKEREDERDVIQKGSGRNQDKALSENKTDSSENKHKSLDQSENKHHSIDSTHRRISRSHKRYRSRSRSHRKHRSRTRYRSKERHRHKHREYNRSRNRERRKHELLSPSSHRSRNFERVRSRSKGRRDARRANSKDRYRSHHSRKSESDHKSRHRSRLPDTSASKEDAIEEDLLKPLRSAWIRSSPADLYYQKREKDVRISEGTPKLKLLQDRFQYELVERSARIKATKEVYQPPPRKICLRLPKLQKLDDSSSSDDDTESEEEDTSLEELERKKKHPDRLHEELWYNDPGEMNDGPVCRCSAKARSSGIRHNIYPGELHLPPCDQNSNNADRLYHYHITMSPYTNFLTKCPTIIKHDSHEYIFEGFSMFSHSSLKKLPTCKVIRFNIEYTILYLEEKFPDNFTICDLDLFATYLFREVLELVDLDWKAHDDPDGCPRVHFMPRFSRSLEDNGKEVLSMNVVLNYLLNTNYPLVKEEKLPTLMKHSQHKWQDFADEVRGMIVTYPGMKPCSLRVDQLDRDQCDPEKGIYPEIVHFGIRPPQLSYAGNPSYQKAWRDYVKFRHLLANKPKVVYADRHKLLRKEMKLQEMRMKNNLKRDVTVVVSSKNFYRTGVMCDVVQHAMLLPVLVCHIRFHHSLDILEQKLKTNFCDRYLLQLALTHPSYRENFGTNPDHARNSLTNCGIRQPEYGDRRIHYMNTRKRGINTLINIMSRFGRREETASNINHNERLEFLGDAVVEFLSSIHLFYMFPDLEEGGLATYRAALVQNQHLAVLAKKLELEKFMLYAHGSDLCHDLELRHAMANCFEALMGALFLDSGIDVADRVFCETLFSKSELIEVWKNLPPHPLQEQEPDGDRKWIEVVPLLQKLHEFENQTGIIFTHIRLLARAFTHRSVGYNNLTLGSNQRLEFLGDTVLQLVASEYLYRHFPEHHEGHLSLLRSSLVNNRTQAVVCDDLGMVEYAIYPYPKEDLKTKDRADLLEAFLGALYVDKDLEYCQVFCQVCFFPRLQDFIMNQDWNDPKSKLQQCCLTLRSMDGGEPDIPVYKVIECKGPTNTRIYTVAVYFRGERLASGFGHSIQQAEMAAASNALESSKVGLFPQLRHQKRILERSMKQQDHQLKGKESTAS